MRVAGCALLIVALGIGVGAALGLPAALGAIGVGLGWGLGVAVSAIGAGIGVAIPIVAVGMLAERRANRQYAAFQQSLDAQAPRARLGDHTLIYRASVPVGPVEVDAQGRY